MIRQAVFLVGGLGTRLKDRTRNTPKPLLEVGGRPFIEYLLDEAVRHGFTDILLIAGHFGEQFEARYEGAAWRNGRIRVLREPEPLGTGGALRFAAPELQPRFLLSNGDSFFDVNLRALTADPGVAAGGAVMALRSVAEDTRYGRVDVEDGVVRRFHAASQSRAGPINAGIYCLDRAVADRIPPGKVSLEADIFPGLAAEGRMYGVLLDGYFIDIGVPADFERADREIAARLTRPAVFFDRDGVLNDDIGYVHRREDFVWKEGAQDAVRLCNDLGILAFVVTNQAGVARGLYGEEAIGALHGWMDEQLAAKGAHIDAYEYCAHHLDGRVETYRKACRRRKPEPGMLVDLMAHWPVDRERSLLVGDKQSDLTAATAAGIPAVMYRGGNLYSLLREELARRGFPMAAQR